MSEEDRHDRLWREGLKVQLARIEEVQKTGNGKLDSLSLQVNGRFKKLEDTVFGNEEKSMIGLTEKVRGLDGKRATAIAIIVWVSTVLGNYTVKKVLGALDVPTHAQAGQVHQ